MSKLEKYVPYLSLGFEIVAAITLPILIGYFFIDPWLGTSPWFTVIGCVLGIVNVIALLVRMNRGLNKDE